MEAVDFIDFFKANPAKFACAGGLDPNNDQIPSGPLKVLRGVLNVDYYTYI